jgi:hypothetical protein
MTILIVTLATFIALAAEAQTPDTTSSASAPRASSAPLSQDDGCSRGGGSHL